MRSTAPLLVLLAAACSSAPISYMSTTPAPESSAYECALRQINEMGYTVTNADKGAGLIAAEHQTSSGVGEFMSGKKYRDVLTVSIFDAADSTKGRRLRVTAAQTTEAALTLFGNASKSQTAPSKSGKADAAALLHACAPGAAVQEVSGVGYAVEARALTQ